MSEDFQGLIGKYQVIKTDDDSLTLFSEAFNEACHSTSGAREETLYNYIHGCELIEKAQNNQDLCVFEVGLGLGLGYQLTINSLPESYAGKITFITTEIDPGLITWCKANTPLKEDLCSFYPSYRDLQEVPMGELITMQAEKNGHRLIVLIGNARVSVPLAIQEDLLNEAKVDAIFQDPFSPKRNPTLWTVEWFELLKSFSKPEIILSTYSASSSIRKALIEAGFVLENRKGFGTKRTATRAFLKGETPLELTESLSRSPAPPFRD